jgi:hypothetical protein
MQEAHYFSVNVPLVKGLSVLYGPPDYFPLMKDAAGGLLSPLGPSPLCDYSVVSDNSLLLYTYNEL